MKPVPSEPQRLLDGGGEGPEAEAMRGLLSRLAEPPVEEVSRERIWRRMTAPPGHATVHSWYGRMAAVAALMLALTGALALHHRRPASDFTLVRVGAQAALLASPGSEIELEGSGAERSVRWSGSSLSVVVENANPAFVVQAGTQRIEASTAAFEVVQQSAGDMTVSAQRGEVEVIQGSRHWRVCHGERWSSSHPEALSEAGPPSARIPALDQALIDQPHPMVALLEMPRPAAEPLRPRPLAEEGRGEGSASPPTLHPVMPSPIAASAAPRTKNGEPHPTEAKPSPSSPGAEREAPAEVRAAESSTPIIIAPPLLAPPIVVAQREAVPPPVSAPPPVTAPVPQPAAGPAPAAPQHYEEALDLERTGHFAEAAHRLQAVVSSRDPHADLALYELGRLDQRQLHDLPGAHDAFSSYVDTYPRGSLQQEVRLSLIEVDAALSKSKEALSLASSFLETYPSSERAPDVRLLRANLLREKGRCDDALADYRQLVVHPTLGEEALFFTAWCQRQDDRLDEAEASLRELLRRFPSGRYASEAKAALAGEK